ncbi:hypothetical protein [Clostridium estertheticum]|uniref:hypothetical protein n=1 Tax=Clostridium estertheticum TaxID=238834 RepID=UPI001C0C379A|nr:hypothetical protein [Clostridium estertheticum]MBU3187199.1 hypothetical protein [Clostridium estertheticum]
MDNKDVFALCNYNILYEVRLKGAIDKGNISTRVPLKISTYHNRRNDSIRLISKPKLIISYQNTYV